MYDIYIKNYQNADGTPIVTEQLLYSVPITNSLMALKDPVVKTEMGKTGSFEFSLHPKHPYFNGFNQMKTILRVVYDGDTIFRGRTLTIDNTLKGEKKVHCEGDLAFLLDSLQPGTKETEREEIDILTYLNQIMNNHNMQVIEDGSDDKRMVLGEVPGQYSRATAAQRVVVKEEKKKYGSNGYEQTMNALESLQKEYGGYFRTRYENGTCYLDWLEESFRDGTNSQIIEVGENLIDMSSTTEVDSIFTALIPIGSNSSKEVYISEYKTDVHGHNNRILVPQIVGEFTDAELNKGYHRKEYYLNAVNQYGIIYKTQKFSNADTPEKLWEYAVDWIKDNYMGGVTSFSLSALDMHHKDGEVEKYLTGDRLTVKYPGWDTYNHQRIEETITLTLTQTTYHLHNPEKNGYTIGVPNGVLSKTYGKSKQNGGGGGGSGNQGDNDPEYEAEQRRIEIERLKSIAKAFTIGNYEENFPEFMEYQKEHPNEAYYMLQANALNLTTTLEGYSPDLPWSEGAKKTARSIFLDGHNGEFVINGPVSDMVKYSQEMTDEERRMFNNMNRSIMLNGLKHEFGMSAVMDFLAGPGVTPPQAPGPQLLQMKVNDENQTAVKIWSDKKLENSEEPETTALTPSSVISQLLGAGKDATGKKNTVTADGLNSTFGMMPKELADADELNKYSSILLNGNNGGVANLGKTSPTEGFTVGLNEELEFPDVDGNLQKIAGWLRGNDIKTTSIPSLNTKLVVTDQLIAKKADITELNALTARIDTLEANMISTEWLEAMIARMRVVSTIRLDANQFNFAGEALFMQNSPGFITGINYRPPTITLGSVQTFQLANGGTATGRLVSTYAAGSLTTTNRAIRYLGRYTSG